MEFAVYGFIAYSSLLMLIISITKEGPMIKTRTGTLVKSMYIMPGIICMILLSGSGVFIFYDTGGVILKEVYNGTGALISNSTEIIPANQIELQNPVWVPLHYMLALIMFAYVIVNVLKMFSAVD